MREANTFYLRNLPHYQPPNATYFITFRLTGSLPTEIIVNLKEEYVVVEKRLRLIADPMEKTRELRTHHSRYFVKLDEFLDKHSHGPIWLTYERIAKIVVDAIRYRDGREYELIAYCIMPNHVHMVFSLADNVTQTSVCANENDRTEVRSTAPYQNYRLARIMRSLKGATSREANRVLQRSGAFWQHESYDHVVRDGKELEKIISYVLNNPVKAGFADDWRKWKWIYCKYEM